MTLPTLLLGRPCPLVLIRVATLLHVCLCSFIASFLTAARVCVPGLDMAGESVLDPRSTRPASPNVGGVGKVTLDWKSGCDSASLVNPMLELSLWGSNVMADTLPTSVSVSIPETERVGR